MEKVSIDILESQRAKSETFIKHGYASNWNLQAVIAVGKQEFQINKLIEITSPDPDRTLAAVSEIYQRFDEWKAEQAGKKKVLTN